MDKKYFYSLGQRDTLAGILAENFKEKKLPEIAKLYKDNFGDHFTLKWHLNK